ncbi:MAG: hypothetical protein AB8I08_15905 [Sandaracinaceae bacterium]
MSAAACQNHPRREAIGICIACRAQVCNECVTKIDGINHCVGCYTRLAERDAPRAHTSSSATTSWLAGLGLLGLAVVLTWAMLEAALPGGG